MLLDYHNRFLKYIKERIINFISLIKENYLKRLGVSCSTLGKLEGPTKGLHLVSAVDVDERFNECPARKITEGMKRRQWKDRLNSSSKG